MQIASIIIFRLDDWRSIWRHNNKKKSVADYIWNQLHKTLIASQLNHLATTILPSAYRPFILAITLCVQYPGIVIVLLATGRDIFVFTTPPPFQQTNKILFMMGGRRCCNSSPRYANRI